MPKITRENYLRDKSPRRGNKNPELMDVDFWKYMVVTGYSAWEPRVQFKDTRGLRSPVWTFSRFGMTTTKLADGRTVHIGGEHEDWYDPDFYIYNDVIIRTSTGDIMIYGYPEEVFPPTDFHTATLVQDQIYIIGCLGYPKDRHPEITPVYRLDCTQMTIERVETSGSGPGWIHKHTAVHIPENNLLEIHGGKIWVGAGRTGELHDNGAKLWLNLSHHEWVRYPSTT